MLQDRVARRSRSSSTYSILVRHFFARFFDKESLSPQGEPEANLAQILGLLAVPSAFFVLLFRPLDVRLWDLVMVRYFFVSLSMLVMGFVMVFEWDALFPDKRDYQVLTPLPLRLWMLFLAKIHALALLLAVFLVDVNFFGTLFWPGIEGKPDVLAILGTHVLVVLAGGLFTALAIGALQGVLVTVFNGRIYRRLSVALQTLLMAILVMLLFLTPLIGAWTRELMRGNHPVIYWLPPFWFLGLYEQIRPATKNLTLRGLGPMALQALGWAAALFVLTYLPLYRRHARRVLEAPETNPSGPGRLRRGFEAAVNRWVLANPIERGVFHFISETITRSTQHRLFLATYGGFGAALAVMHMGSDQGGLLRLPLTLSFILVSGLRAAFNFPSELRANQAFQMTESNAGPAYVEATRKWIVVCGILPLFLLLAPMEFVSFTWPVALFHSAYGIILSLLLAELMFLGFHKVPFTCSYRSGKVNLVGLSALYVMGFTMYSQTMAGFESALISIPVAAIAFFAVAVAVLVYATWRRRVAKASVLQYEDTEPMIRTLGLEPH